jgi:hypothetical protein
MATGFDQRMDVGSRSPIDGRAGPTTGLRRFDNPARVK